MLTHMRTTLNIDDQLMSRVRQMAARRGVTLTQVFEDALREMLANLEASRIPTSFEIPVVEGRRPPAVDFADRDVLYEHLDGRR